MATILMNATYPHAGQLMRRRSPSPDGGNGDMAPADRGCQTAETAAGAHGGHRHVTAKTANMPHPRPRLSKGRNGGRRAWVMFVPALARGCQTAETVATRQRGHRHLTAETVEELFSALR